MLENLRRKSLVQTYNDPRYQVHFEQGVAKYGNHVEIDVCSQKLHKELQKMSSKKQKESVFKKAIDMISKETFSFFKLNMIYCPKGTFTIGHKDYDYNQPRQETINRPFLLGETEITQELYEKVMGQNPSKFKNPQNPVEQVSWEDAILFCNELSRLQGLDLCYTKKSDKQYDWLCYFNKNGYRLPEEKEWEYAAKAGTQNKYAGTNEDDKVSEYAWFADNSKISRTYQTHLVATKRPNEWGFYDMSGNVSEWCWNEFDSRDTNYRVIRGGSYNAHPISYLNLATRPNRSLDDRSNDVGFRVCRSVVN